MLVNTVTLALAAFSAFAAASPVYGSKPDCPIGDTNPECQQWVFDFVSIALRSASPIHFLPLQARDGNIWLGGEPDSECPPGNCPKKFGKNTVLSVNNKQASSSLSVAVPGGQQVYIAPDGSLSYTPPHSGAIPKGSFTSGFGVTVEDTGSFTYSGGGGATGFVACPEGKGDNKEWKVYADTKKFKKAGHKGCLGFDTTASEYKANKGVGAYEYS